MRTVVVLGGYGNFGKRIVDDLSKISSDDPADVPADIKAAIKFRIGDLFNIRDSTTKNPIGTTASNLLEQHRIQEF